MDVGSTNGHRGRARLTSKYSTIGNDPMTTQLNANRPPNAVTADIETHYDMVIERLDARGDTETADVVRQLRRVFLAQRTQITHLMAIFTGPGTVPLPPAGWMTASERAHP
jgi:hypothetical protein